MALFPYTAAAPLNLFVRREDIVWLCRTISSLLTNTLGVGPLRKGGWDLLYESIAPTVLIGLVNLRLAGLSKHYTAAAAMLAEEQVQ
jgi:hypothetical protein